MDTKTEFSPDNIIKDLLDINKPFTPEYLHFFSDISDNNLQQIKQIWSDIRQERKINLLSDLETLTEADTLVSFDDFGYFALQDNDPQIKSHAIRLLQECKDINLIEPFLDLLTTHENPDVNAAAARALGKFVLLGELEEIPEKYSSVIKVTLLEEYRKPREDRIRQRILESLGYLSDDEVKGIISDALKNDNKDWQLSAIFAISRSANEKWGNEVLEKIIDIDPDISLEAIKAAGELEIASAKEELIDILKFSSPDEEIYLQSIWALSKIGGNDIQDLFEEMLESSEMEEETEMLELAMDNLTFTNGISSFDFFDED